MFGKGKTQMSANDKFVMAMGRKNGNLSAPVKADKVVKTSAAGGSSKAGVKGRNNLGAIGHAKLTPAVRGEK